MKCKGCHKRIRKNTRGRPRVFCSDACRYRERDKHRGPRPGNRKPQDRWRQLKPAVGVDSETPNVDGRPMLQLIAASNGGYIQKFGSERITTDESLEFLLRAAEDGQLWTFFGDYDVNFWLADFHPRALDRLRKTGWTRWKRWRVHHIPRRCFEVWDLSSEPRAYACVYDAFPFVQKSFVKWLDEWKLAPARVIERIAAMKEQRADFDRVSPDRILKYTQDEVHYIAEGVRRLRERVRSAGYSPARWLGPGAVASQALRREGIKDHMPRKTPATVARVADQAYYGGRIETGVVGSLVGPLYQYDLASAYPAAAVDLPCLRHGKWTHHKGAPYTSALVDGEAPPQSPTLCRVHWKPYARRKPRWGPFPLRSRQGVSLRYYREGRGWYWLDEVLPWLASPEYDVTITQHWTWNQTCRHRPFAFVRDLYERRAVLKAAGDPAEYCVKLVLNSLYGKLAQKVGAKPFLCFEWAGLITARTRGRIGRLLVRHGDAIHVIATDAVISSKPLDIAGTGLGSWEGPERIDWADVWQPGFYILKKAGESGIAKRTRGFLGTEITDREIRAMRQAWRRMRTGARVEIPRRRVVGYRLAAHLGQPALAGTWNEQPALVNFDPKPRRLPTLRALGRPPRQAMVTRAPRSRDHDLERAGNVQDVWEALRAEADLWADGVNGGFETG